MTQETLYKAMNLDDDLRRLERFRQQVADGDMDPYTWHRILTDFNLENPLAQVRESVLSALDSKKAEMIKQLEAL